MRVSTSKALPIVVLILLFSLIFSIYKHSKGTPLTSETTEIVKEDTQSEKYNIVLATTDKSIKGSYNTGLPQHPKLSWYDATIKQEEPNVDIDVNYPQFVGDEIVTQLNQYIGNTLTKLIEEDMARMKDLIASAPDDFGSHVYLTTSYKVMGVIKGVVSIEIVAIDFTGGGNGNHSYPITINWDLKSNRLLKNTELFCSKDYISTLMPLVRKQILKDFSSSDHIQQPLSGDIIEGVNYGTENESDNWEHFLLTKDGLMAVFPPYQVTSGAEGIVRAFVPYTDIPNLVCLP